MITTFTLYVSLSAYFLYRAYIKQQNEVKEDKQPSDLLKEKEFTSNEVNSDSVSIPTPDFLTESYGIFGTIFKKVYYFLESENFLDIIFPIFLCLFLPYLINTLIPYAVNNVEKVLSPLLMKFLNSNIDDWSGSSSNKKGPTRYTFDPSKNFFVITGEKHVSDIFNGNVNNEKETFEYLAKNHYVNPAKIEQLRELLDRGELKINSDIFDAEGAKGDFNISKLEIKKGLIDYLGFPLYSGDDFFVKKGSYYNPFGLPHRFVYTPIYNNYGFWAVNDSKELLVLRIRLSEQHFQSLLNNRYDYLDIASKSDKSVKSLFDKYGGDDLLRKEYDRILKINTDNLPKEQGVETITITFDQKRHLVKHRLFVPVKWI
jgi:hypothetical protein